jgi:hypothetical protein
MIAVMAAMQGPRSSLDVICTVHEKPPPRGAAQFAVPAAVGAASAILAAED